MAQRYTGTIASFNPKKGWGYIHEPELLATYGKDVFLHQDYVTTELNVGDAVEFDIELRPDGKPQARNICLPGEMPIPSPQAGPQAGYSPAGPRYQGTIVSFNDKKGWGYITAPDLLAKFGKDVFLHRDYIDPSFSPLAGAPVEFSIELRASDGMPQARGICAPGGKTAAPQRRLAAPPASHFARAPMARMPMAPVTRMAPMARAPMAPMARAPVARMPMAPVTRMAPMAPMAPRGTNPHAQRLAAPRFQAPVQMMAPVMAVPQVLKRPMSNSQSGRFTGQVVSFNETKGWGYIHCVEISNQCGKDVFLHRDYLPQGFVPEVGSILTFTTELRSDGKPQARNIDSGVASDRYQGTVVSFNPVKGWGYIDSPELKAQYGKDVFLHRDYCEPGFSTNQGDVLDFAIEIRAKDGMPQAREVRTIKGRRMM